MRQYQGQTLQHNMTMWPLLTPVYVQIPDPKTAAQDLGSYSTLTPMKLKR